MQAAARLIDIWALLLVSGGACLAAAVTVTLEDMRRALAALGPLVRAKPAAEARLSQIALGEIERVVDARGVVCADHVQTKCRFVRRAALALADAPSADAFRTWGELELAARRTRHESAWRLWRGIADAAPAMGMIGTVIGLIGMFAAMEDPDRIGSAMALAMLTTLYGLFVSSGVAGPIAARLERLSDVEAGWQRAALERLAALAKADTPEHRQWLKRRLKADG